MVSKVKLIFTNAIVDLNSGQLPEPIQDRLSIARIYNFSAPDCAYSTSCEWLYRSIQSSFLSDLTFCVMRRSLRLDACMPDLSAARPRLAGPRAAIATPRICLYIFSRKALESKQEGKWSPRKKGQHAETEVLDRCLPTAR